jgi:ribonuclease inhibitor
MEVVLEGMQIGSESDLHRMLSEKLDFGPYYGHNLAALWDRLTTDVERPIHLTWKNAAYSQKSINKHQFKKIIQIFIDVQHQDEELGRTEKFTFSCE